MSTAVPKATFNTVKTRLKTKRDLETTMDTLKRLLQPTFSKKGSRKKNKPRSLAKKVLPPKKTIKRFENCSEDDGEYYPNKLKRKVEEKKTILKPTHKLKVVVAMNKRKRLTPHKGLEQIYEESLINQDVPQQDNVSTVIPDSNVHTETYNLNVQSASSNTNVHNTPLYTETDNFKVHTAPNNNNVHNVSSTTNVHTAPNNANVHNVPSTTNVHTEPDLKVHTPPPSSKPDIYELISPPHKSLTQLTVDDLIRMDEDSLSDEDLMEILTCPSPVWWEDPSNERGALYLTTASEVLEPIDDSKKNKNELKTYSNKKSVSIKKIHTVSVGVGKANKIAKLENVLGHIKSLVQIDDKDQESFNDNDKISKDDKNFELKDENNDKKSKMNDDLPKRRTVSSSGSEISVNEHDLLRNLENIDIPIRKINNDNSCNVQNLDVNKLTVNIDNKIPIHNNDIQICILKDELPDNEIIKTVKDARKRNVAKVSKRQYKSNKKHKQDSKISVFHKTKGLNTLLDSNKEASKPDNEVKASQSNITSILNKLKPNDDILDVRLIKIPTNVTNEVKIWSKLDNFKRHNFKPTDFENDVIDIEDELEFSMIENSSNKNRDPLDTRDEAILIDDDSNDALNEKSIFNDIINLDVIQQCNDVTITAIENDDSSQNSIIEIDPKVMVDDIIKEDTIRIGNDLDVRLIETSVQKTKRRRKTVLKLDKNSENKKNKCNEVSENILAETFEIQLYDTTKETNSKWHINNYLQYGEQSNDRGIFRVIDTDDTSDTILRLNDDVDVSLVKNPRSNDAIISANETKNNDLSITLVNKANDDVTITPIALPTLTKNPKQTFESPISIKSVNSEGVEYSEGTISDTNIHFLDEYGDKIDEFAEINTLNVEDVVKDSLVKNIDIGENEIQEIVQNEIDMNVTSLDTAEESMSEENLHKDLNEADNNEVNSNENNLIDNKIEK